nr:retrovirus-related Pol polyprotein from transposon TNT 1-94 [Tanacetum cinerariifolium]
MEAGSKDRPPMLAHGNYIQWKSQIKTYINTKPYHELIHYCLENPPYELGWKTKPILDSDGNPTTLNERVCETYKSVTQEIKDQLNAEAEAVQIILTGIDNDIYSTVDACPNACEMWKAIERLKQEPSMVDDDDEMSKDKEIDKLMALISLSFKKIYKPTNNNLRTSSNTSRANQDNSPRIHRNAGYESQRSGNVAGARETVGLSMGSPDAVDSGPIFDKEPEQKVQNNDQYDMFTIKCQHPEQSKSVHKTYLIEQDAHNMLIESEDMNYDSEQIDQNDEDADLAEERELLASLIEKLKCEIDETKNRNTLLETSNKVLVEKLKSELADFRNKNKSLTEANNKLSKENDLLFADFMKSKVELKRRDSIEYATEMELKCAKVKAEFYTYKMESQRSCNKYTQTINDLNQAISEMKNKLSAHQDTISVLKQQKDAQIKLYKSREDKEIERVIDLENKVKVLDNIVYKTGQTVQTMNMLNNKCCYNDNLALLLSLESDEVIRLEKESRSKLKRSRVSDITVQKEKKSFNKQPTLLEKQLDESIPLGKICKSSLELSKNDIVVGLPKLKFVKDHLSSSCELRKAKRKSFQSKLTPSSKRWLQLLHMDLCGPMRVASINGKKYVLVIVDDYSRYTWTHFLRSKDETPIVIIDFLSLVQRGLQAQVRVVRTDKGTKCLNQTLHAYFAVKGIQHQTSIARTPEQNGVVERRNRTLVEAARTMLSAANLPLFFWAEAVATACFTQNRSLVIPHHEKTPYHIINDRKPSVKFFHIFGS